MDWITRFPNRWPTPWRRAFVLLFPITIPLWLGGWVVSIATMFCLGVAILVFVGICLLPALLWAAWQGKKVGDAFEVVFVMWFDIFAGIKNIGASMRRAA